MDWKIERFLEKEISSLKDVLILKNDTNHYYLFGKYEITPLDNQYKVELSDVYKTETFNYVQCAITWCLYHYNKKHASLKRIQQLDNRLTALDLSIKIHKRMLSDTKPIQDVYILETKLEDELMKKERLQRELDSLVDASKNWQLKKFKEKTT